MRLIHGVVYRSVSRWHIGTVINRIKILCDAVENHMNCFYSNNGWDYNGMSKREQDRMMQYVVLDPCKNVYMIPRNLHNQISRLFLLRRHKRTQNKKDNK